MKVLKKIYLTIMISVSFMFFSCERSRPMTFDYFFENDWAEGSWFKGDWEIRYTDTFSYGSCEEYFEKTILLRVSFVDPYYVYSMNDKLGYSDTSFLNVISEFYNKQNFPDTTNLELIGAKISGDKHFHISYTKEKVFAKMKVSLNGMNNKVEIKMKKANSEQRKLLDATEEKLRKKS